MRCGPAGHRTKERIGAQKGPRYNPSRLGNIPGLVPWRPSHTDTRPAPKQTPRSRGSDVYMMHTRPRGGKDNNTVLQDNNRSCSGNIAPEHQTYLLRGPHNQETTSRRGRDSKRKAGQHRTGEENDPHLQVQHAPGVYTELGTMHIEGGPHCQEAMARHNAEING